MAINSDPKTDRLTQNILEAIQKFVDDKISEYIALKKQEMEQEIEKIKAEAIAQAGVKLARYVDIQHMNDRIVIRIEASKDES
jgi:Fe2+ transport system protein B